MELRILVQLILLFMFRPQWLFRTGTSVTIPRAKGITCYLNKSSSISLSPPRNTLALTAIFVILIPSYLDYAPFAYSTKRKFIYNNNIVAGIV